MLEFPKRIEFYNRSISFAYDLDYDRYYNQYYNAYWHSLQHRFIGIGIDRLYLFHRVSCEHEAGEYYSITIFGIRFDKGLIFQAEQCEKEENSA